MRLCTVTVIILSEIGAQYASIRFHYCCARIHNGRGLHASNHAALGFVSPRSSKICEQWIRETVPQPIGQLGGITTIYRGTREGSDAR